MAVNPRLPQYSHDFENSFSAQYLSMGSEKYGTVGNTFSFTCRFKCEATTGTRYLISKGDAGTSGDVLTPTGFWVRINNDGRVRAQCGALGECIGMLCPVGHTVWGASTTTVNDTDEHELLVYFDPNNATQSERIKIWIDGSLETLAASSLSKGTLTTNSVSVKIGASYNGGSGFDGLIYNLATTTSGNLFSINDIRVDDGTAKDLKDYTNLKVHPDLDAGSIISEWANANEWTNNNSVAKSDTLLDLSI